MQACPFLAGGQNFVIKYPQASGKFLYICVVIECVQIIGKMFIEKTNQVVFLCLAQALSTFLFGSVWGFMSDVYNHKVIRPPQTYMHKL